MSSGSKGGGGLSGLRAPGVREALLRLLQRVPSSSRIRFRAFFSSSSRKASRFWKSRPQCNADEARNDARHGRFVRCFGVHHRARTAAGVWWGADRH